MKKFKQWLEGVEGHISPFMRILRNALALEKILPLGQSLGNHLKEMKDILKEVKDLPLVGTFCSLAVNLAEVIYPFSRKDPYKGKRIAVMVHAGVSIVTTVLGLTFTYILPPVAGFIYLASYIADFIMDGGYMPLYRHKKKKAALDLYEQHKSATNPFSNGPRMSKKVIKKKLAMSENKASKSIFKLGLAALSLFAALVFFAPIPGAQILSIGIILLVTTLGFANKKDLIPFAWIDKKVALALSWIDKKLALASEKGWLPFSWVEKKVPIKEKQNKEKRELEDLSTHLIEDFYKKNPPVTSKLPLNSHSSSPKPTEKFNKIKSEEHLPLLQKYSLYRQNSNLKKDSERYNLCCERSVDP